MGIFNSNKKVVKELTRQIEEIVLDGIKSKTIEYSCTVAKVSKLKINTYSLFSQRFGSIDGYGSNSIFGKYAGIDEVVLGRATRLELLKGMVRHLDLELQKPLVNDEDSHQITANEDAIKKLKYTKSSLKKVVRKILDRFILEAIDKDLFECDSYIVKCGKFEIWIDNYPYSFGKIYRYNNGMKNQVNSTEFRFAKDICPTMKVRKALRKYQLKSLQKDLKKDFK